MFRQMFIQQVITLSVAPWISVAGQTRTAVVLAQHPRVRAITCARHRMCTSESPA
jgi:hypothetical protein